jgi:hypothetical protein
VETKESTGVHVYFSWTWCLIIEQEVNGEKSCSLDLKRWAIAEDKLVVIKFLWFKT